MALAVLSLCLSAQAERPSAMKLFPEESVVFVRIANANDLGQKMQQTSLGRMFQDPQLKPFVETLYGKRASCIHPKPKASWASPGTISKNYPRAKSRSPSLLAPEKRPALLLLIDQGDEASVADKLVDKVLDIAQEKGGEFARKRSATWKSPSSAISDRENRMFGVCERDNTIIVATDPNVIRGVLWHWDHPAAKAAAMTLQRAKRSEAKSGNVATAEQRRRRTRHEPAEEEPRKQAAEFVPGRTLAQNDALRHDLQAMPPAARSAAAAFVSTSIRLSSPAMPAAETPECSLPWGCSRRSASTA